MKKVVIITAFHENRKKLVLETIQSVVGLKIPKDICVEYIILRNGKFDSYEVSEIAGNSIKKDFAIYMITSPNNTGATIGGNYLIHTAQAREADYILPIDSDDIFLPDFLIETMEIMNTEKYDMVGTYFKTFGNTNTIIEWDNCLTFERMRKERIAPPYQMLYKADCFACTGGFDSRLTFANDFEHHLRLAQAGYKYHIIEKPLYLYRHSGNQETDGRFNDNEWKDLAYKLNNW